MTDVTMESAWKFHERKFMMVALLIICAGTFLARGFTVTWDPPTDYERSMSLMTDEGPWIVSGRNAALGYETNLDSTLAPPYPVVHPAWSLISSYWMDMFGVSLETVRWLGNFAFTLAHLFLGLLLIRACGHRYSPVFGMIVFGVSFPLFLYGRTALVENFALLYGLVLAMLAIRPDRSARMWALFLSTLLVLVKLQYSYLFGVVVLFIAVDEGKTAFSSKRVFGYLTATVIGFLLVGVLWWYPRWDVITALFSSTNYSNKSVRSLSQMIRSVVYSGYECELFPRLGVVVTYLCVSYPVFHLKSLVIKKTSRVDLFMLFWLLIGFLGFSAWAYRPLRYFIPLGVPVIYFAARRVDCYFSDCACREGRKAVFYGWITAVGTLFLLLEYKMVLGLTRRELLLIVLIVVGLFTVYHFLRSKYLGAAFEQRLLVPVLFLVVLAWNVVPLHNWKEEHSEDFVRANRKLSEHLSPGDDVLVRNLATNAAFNSPAKLHLLVGKWSEEKIMKMVRRHRIRFILAGSGKKFGLEAFYQKHASPVENVRVGTHRLVLYRLKEHSF